MFSIQPSPLPDNALLAAYARDGGYTDCYAVDVPGTISQEQYITAFYTTAVFKLERMILRFAVSKPSTDTQARQLAAGSTDEFAAWRVEQRNETQLLMCDFTGRTRSWLMTLPLPAQHGGGTRLYFGSAVVPAHPGKAGLGFTFTALLGFHKLYSQTLLHAARKRLHK